RTARARVRAVSEVRVRLCIREASYALMAGRSSQRRPGIAHTTVSTPPTDDAIVRHIDDPDVQPILEHEVECLRAHLQAAPRAQAESRDVVQDLPLREPACREVFERTSNERRSLGIFDEALPAPPRCVQE